MTESRGGETNDDRGPAIAGPTPGWPPGTTPAHGGWTTPAGSAQGPHAGSAWPPQEGPGWSTHGSAGPHGLPASPWAAAGGHGSGAWAVPAQASPAPGYVYAGFWVRLAAYLIDLVPFFIVVLLLFLPAMNAMFSELAPVMRQPGEVTPEELERLLQRQMTAMHPLYALSGLAQLLSALYYIGFWTWRGQTPGKMLLGLHVVRENDGRRPGLARSILRYVGYTISAFALLIGFIWIAFDQRKQGWHDKIAGTVVVKRMG